MDKGHIAQSIVNIVRCLLCCRLLFSSCWFEHRLLLETHRRKDTQRPLDRTATLCDRELVFVTVCASTGGHQRQYPTKENSATVQEEVFW